MARRGEELAAQQRAEEWKPRKPKELLQNTSWEMRNWGRAGDSNSEQLESRPGLQGWHKG